MTLATRCPNCQTMFRVVQDQLRVSEGWVRCGRCTEVFNAAENLVDPGGGETRRAPIEVHRAFTPPVAADAAAPADDEAPIASPPAPGAGPAAPAGAATPDASDDIEAELRERLAARAGDAARSAADGDPADAASTVERAAGASASPGTGFGAAAHAPAPVEPTFEPPQAPELPQAPEGFVAGVRPPGVPGGLPSFVRAAHRAERWRRPGTRVLLAAGLVAATLLLAGQWLYVYRDYAAARWPALRPRLVQACGMLGCRVAPMRSIEALVVENSGLVRVEKTDVYRLNVAVRNQHAFEVALPAVDLSLTDTQGQLIARRILRAAELGAAASTLAAGGELALQATIQVAAAPVAGYTIELFYP